MEATIHQAVLVEETMQVLDVRPGGTYLDGTLGGATYTEELIKHSGSDGRVLSLDVDPKALGLARARMSFAKDRWKGVEANFRWLDQVAHTEGFVPLDGVVLDLGLSSDEIEDASRGFSFLKNGPLDMRFGPYANESGLTAADIVNSWPKDAIVQILREYGEERFAERIADSVVKARCAARIVGTLDLVSVVRQAVPITYEHGRIHPATRTFQALRIAVNDELAALRDAIQAAHHVLKDQGRLVIVSFHSLEDRIVKFAFKDANVWTAITKKPLVASREEIKRNPRARSAKLRAAINHQVSTVDDQPRSEALLKADR